MKTKKANIEIFTRWGNVYLELIDPERNHKKYYGLRVIKGEGKAVLIRHWGRIGTDGQFKVENFDRPGLARNTAVSLLWEKQGKGYEVRKISGFFERA